MTSLDSICSIKTNHLVHNNQHMAVLDATTWWVDSHAPDSGIYGRPVQVRPDSHPSGPKQVIGLVWSICRSPSRRWPGFSLPGRRRISEPVHPSCVLPAYSSVSASTPRYLYLGVPWWACCDGNQSITWSQIPAPNLVTSHRGYLLRCSDHAHVTSCINMTTDIHPYLGDHYAKIWHAVIYNRCSRMTWMMINKT